MGFGGTRQRGDGVTNRNGIIVVGADGSANSERAIEWAVNEASAHGGTVLLVHAWQYPGMAMTSFAGEPLPVFGREDLQKIAVDILNRAARHARASAPNANIDTRLVEGHPVTALVDASKGADLLVVGSRGVGGFKGMLMGSVSSSCVHHSACPVLVVPPSTELAA